MANNPICKCGNVFDLAGSDEGDVTHELPYSHMTITFEFACMECGATMLGKPVKFFIVPERDLMTMGVAYVNQYNAKTESEGKDD